IGETNLPGEKCRHRALVGGVEDGGRRTSRPASGDTEVQRRKTVVIDRLVSHWRKFNGIESWYTLVSHAFRMGERIENRQFHGGDAHLCQHAAIDELDERVNDALWMHHHVDPIVRKSEQKMGLDDFERLIGESRAVDGDLASHSPRRVSQRVLDRRRRQPFDAPVAKRTTRGGQHDATNLRRRMTGDALQDRAVLAVNGNYFARARRAGLPHQITSDDESFLVGERHPLSALERCQSGIETRGTDDGIEDNVHVAPGGRRDEGVGSVLPRIIAIALRFDHTDERRRELERLLSEQRRVAVGGERCDAESFALAIEHAERRCSDRAGRAQHRYPFGSGQRGHCGIGSSNRPSMRNAIGITNRRLSNRSRIPPCPGMMRELSLIPDSGLSSDSARSPVCAATLTTIANNTAPWMVRPSWASGMSTNRT